MIKINLHCGPAVIIDRFHRHATTKEIGNCSVEEAKKMKCYKRLMYEQFVQVLSLCGPLALMHINISSNTWNGHTAENQEERLSFQQDSIPFFGVTHCENLEVQIAVFSKWNMLWDWKLVQRFIFGVSSA